MEEVAAEVEEVGVEEVGVEAEEEEAVVRHRRRCYCCYCLAGAGPG